MESSVASDAKTHDTHATRHTDTFTRYVATEPSLHCAEAILEELDLQSQLP